MKFILSTLTILSMLQATQWISINPGTSEDFKVTIEESNIEKSVLTFNIDGFTKKLVETNSGQEFTITTDGSTPILNSGHPDLSKLTASVIIPNSGNMKIDILDSKYIDYNNILVAPSKGNLLRSVNPESIPYEYGDQYQKDEFYPNMIAELRDPYIARDFRGQTVIAYPFQYNPVTKTLRVHYSITVSIENIGGSGLNEKSVSRQNSSKIVKEYDGIYESHFENYNNVDRYDALSDQGNMLIVCYDSFIDEMQPFVDWKRLKGIPTEIVSVSDIGGSSSSISSFVEDYYFAEGLTFLLLVGDINQIPSPSVGGSASDPTYGFIEGNDSYPEIIVGRFSAENSSHVATQVQRVINYERYPNANGSWYTTSLGVASNQGPGDDNEDDCEHVQNINSILENYNYNSSSEICDPSGTVSQGVNSINSGVSVINYTGHGSQNSWGNGATLSNNDVNNLTNTSKLPFIWSVACVNGEFHTGTCFAETWLRATHNGEPSGAIGFLGSTVNQSWSPPMEGQDEMNDILVESYGNNIKRTYGGLSANGCMKMNDSYGSSGEYETDYWTLFGDPSVVVRTSEPQILNVDHPDFIMIGSDAIEVISGVGDALVALSRDGELIGSAYSDNFGVAIIILNEPIMQGGEMQLVVTAYNHFPYETDIMAMSPEGAYVVVDEFNMVSDINSNGLVDWGETVSMNIVASNIGVDYASNIVAEVSSSDPYLFNLDNFASFSNIDPSEIVTSDQAINFSVSSDAPFGHNASIDVEFNDDNGNTWMSSYTFMIHHSCGVADINSDGTVNILDIVRAVNIIVNIGQSPTEFEECAANLNGDSLVNILDIISIINFVLDENRPTYSNISQNAQINISENSLDLIPNGAVAGIQLRVKADKIRLNQDLDMNITINKNGDYYDILIYSINGNNISEDSNIFTSLGLFELVSAVAANNEANEINIDYNYMPNNFALYQNYPNPFNPTTTIDFSVASESLVTVKIINLLGKEINTLVNEILDAGYHTIQWDGKNSFGTSVPSGIYIYQLESDHISLNKKMILMK